MTSSHLHINLQAIAENYRILNQLTGPDTRTAAAVKANGYGLGMAPVSEALHQAGCRMFFTAQIDEAIKLRDHFNARQISHSVIACLEGVRKQDIDLYDHHQITPVVNYPEQAEILRGYHQIKGKKIPSILHLDTGMNRLGLGGDTHHLIQQDSRLFQDINWMLVMSHLACSDDPQAAANARQLAFFQQLTQPFGGIAKSLSNSGGIFLPKDYQFDVTRPGIALYGVMPNPEEIHPKLQPAVTWTADIVQIRTLKTGESAGYGGDFVATKPTRLATLAAGYADGYARNLYQPQKGQIARVEIAGKMVPLAGRVSMDLLIADISSLDEGEIAQIDKAILLGRKYRVEDMAKDRQTIAYEVLTGLGDRIQRLYDGLELR